MSAIGRYRTLRDECFVQYIRWSDWNLPLRLSYTLSSKLTSAVGSNSYVAERTICAMLVYLQKKTIACVLKFSVTNGREKIGRSHLIKMVRSPFLPN